MAQNRISFLHFFALVLVITNPLSVKAEEDVDGSGSDSQDTNETKDSVNVPEIYKMAIPMISGEKPITEISDFLLKYFLDETSSSFIWPTLAKELKENFNERHSMTDIDRMERHIRDFKDKMKRCVSGRKGKLQSECFVGFVDLLLDNKNDFWWGSSSKGVRFLNYYISFHLMLLSGMQMCRIQFETFPVKGVDVMEMLKHDIDFFVTQVNDQAWDTCEWRKNEITSVEICKVVDIFRQEYVLYCHDRLVRSEIAKDTNDFMESFRATVYDNVVGEKCFSKRQTVNFGRNKAQLEEALFNEAIKARDKCVKKEHDKCQSYWEPRAYAIAKEISKIKFTPGKNRKGKSNGTKASKTKHV